jgi:hypothetical protein
VSLALDEKFLIQEDIDHYIHRMFNLVETGWTDKIYDVLIGFWGLIGIVILFLYRNELNIHRQVPPILMIGFVFLFISVVLDALTNGASFIPPSLTHSVGRWVGALEECSKLLSEGAFMGFAYSWLISLTRKRASVDRASVPLRIQS